MVLFLSSRAGRMHSFHEAPVELSLLNEQSSGRIVAERDSASLPGVLPGHRLGCRESVNLRAAQWRPESVSPGFGPKRPSRREGRAWLHPGPGSRRSPAPAADTAQLGRAAGAFPDGQTKLVLNRGIDQPCPASLTQILEALRGQAAAWPRDRRCDWKARSPGTTRRSCGFPRRPSAWDGGPVRVRLHCARYTRPGQPGGASLRTPRSWNCIDWAAPNPAELLRPAEGRSPTDRRLASTATGR